MTPRRFVSHLVVAASLLVAASGASAQAKTRIERAADLPRFSYPIEGKVEDVVRSAERFAPFAAAVRRDTEGVLAGYDIADKSARIGLIGVLARLDVLEGRYDDALARVDEIRGLQDKPADKLVASFQLRAIALAAKRQGPSGEAYQRAVAETLQREFDTVPYAVVENDVKRAKASAELLGETLVLGQAREVLQPMVERSASLSSDFAPAIVNARYNLVDVLPLKATLVAAYSSYLAAHQVAKADIWAARDVVLQAPQVRAPVTIAIWDSGVDTPLYPGQVARDGAQPALIAFDKYSRPASGELMALPPAQQGRAAELTARSKGFSDLQSNVDSKEASEVKAYLSALTAERYRPAMEELRLTGGYSHGTHVAGIALAGNPGARLLVARIEYGYTLKPDPCPSRELVERSAAAAQATVDFMKSHGVRVVNMSWSNTIGSYESELEQCGIGKTADERKRLARAYFDAEKAGLTAAFASAPEILFVASAGNSNDNASFVEKIPSGIVLPNLLTVGAVDSAGEEASFTSYGPTVRVHANGYQVESFLPGGRRVALSGTSMSAPQVTNLAAKLLAVNPKLTPANLVRIIVDTADRSADGRRNLINPKQAIAAATAA
jgi:subtilisin family serine protease